MPYFPKTKTLYIHIPKCYGTSVENALKKKSNMTLHATSFPKLKPNCSAPNATRITFPQHFTFKEIQNYDIDISHSFTTVRNPYRRAVSQWKYQVQYQYAFKKTVKHNFRLWVIDLYERYLNGTLRDIRHDCPQTDFIYDENDTLLVDKIIPCENLTTIDNIKLDHANESKLNIKPEITSEIANMLSEIYERDFRLLGYSLDTNKKDQEPKL